MQLFNLSTVTTVAIALSGTALADTITVCLDGSCDFTDPAEASMAAVSGDVIEIAAGTYLLEQPVGVIGSQITVRGAVDAYGQPATVLDGQGSFTVLGVGYSDQSLIENLVITNGHGEYGGGASFIGSNDVVVRNCHFRGNHANWDGGGIRLSLSTTLTLVDCEITDNTANHPSWPGQSRGAGAHVSGATLTLVRTRVCGNVESTSPGRQITGVEESSLGGLGACIQSECDVCVTTEPADLNFDGIVDGADMTILLGSWGGPGSGDLDGNGIVDGADLTRLLGAWS
ncbi:MAG: right-handed parallel beta-helix repeat-containing protein [Phycisphaerales bacterium]|nr:right-handed parallel beta-helix repeat-containing protein [Phycisphaerales bacterium]